MELSVADQGQYLLAKTTGPIDQSAGDLFGQHVRPLVARGGAKVIVDLSDSPRINSAGIASLVRLVADANKNAGRVLLAAPAPFVSQVFRVTRLDRFFEIVPSLSEGEERLREGV